MTNNNYIMLNGRRIDLTDEQIRQLTEQTIHSNPFERVLNGRHYYYSNRYGDVGVLTECNDSLDDMALDAANYFNDKQFAHLVALHQLLYRKLLKFAYDNGCEDTAEWDKSNTHWSIIYDTTYNEFIPNWQKIFKAQEVYFSSKEGAKRAIKEVVEPFMKEHSEFVW